MKNQILILVFTLLVTAIEAQQDIPKSQTGKGIAPLKVVSNQSSVTSNIYAVVVGISDYQDPGIPDLRFADKDAEAFANYLRSKAGGQLDSDHLKLLINQQATMAQFGIALDWLMESAKEGDKVIIYFSGHGDVEKKTLTQPGFLLCWDAPSRVYISGGAFALPMLQEVVSTISVQNKAKVIVITDACRSGKLAGSSVNGSQATASNLSKQFANEIKILSCQPNEYSIEGEQWGGGRGAFSFHLLDALYGMADTDADQWVNLYEVGRYLEDHVAKEVAPISQLPMVLGNRNERVTKVEESYLASIKSGKKNQSEFFSSIESRGIEEEVLAELDTSINSLYKLFKKALNDKKYIKPEDACANFYYEKLIAEPKLTKLHSTLKRNYAAALQDEAQQVMNTMLKNGFTTEITSGIPVTELYKNYPAYLERASELLGEKHYLYRSLQARKYFFNGKIQKTREASKENYLLALQKQSDLPQAYVELISTSMPSEEDSAVYYANKAMALVPNWVVPNIKLAGFYMNKLKNRARAEDLLNVAGVIDSNSLLVWYQKGLFYFRQQDYQKSEFWLKKSVASSEEGICFPCAYNLMGNIYIETSQFEKAEAHFLKAIQLDSNYANALNRLGKIYYRTGRFKEAEDIFNRQLKAAQEESEKTSPYNELGNLYCESNRVKEGAEYYKKSMQADTTYEDPIFNLLNCYPIGITIEEGNEICKKLLIMDSMSIIHCQQVAYFYVKSNNPVLAEYYINKTSIGNESLEYFYTFTCIMSLLGKIDKAFEALEQVAKMGYDYTWMQKDPDLAPLRAQTDRWTALMKKYFPEKFKD
ncbi:MAG: tetratricopeptide repeat protein [Saprospiraceae bacterium]|nr:tetratricopeptide repeat protein [Candidatus Defluviibacterium haderslevense]